MINPIPRYRVKRLAATAPPDVGIRDGRANGTVSTQPQSIASSRSRSVQLASEHQNVGTRRAETMRYFESMDFALGGHGLSLREWRRRLNGTRIALRHHGTQPAVHEVTARAADVDRFKVRNAQLVFGMVCSSLSMAALVVEGAVPACIERADDQTGNPVRCPPWEAKGRPERHLTPCCGARIVRSAPTQDHVLRSASRDLSTRAVGLP